MMSILDFIIVLLYIIYIHLCLKVFTIYYKDNLLIIFCSFYACKMNFFLGGVYILDSLSVQCKFCDMWQFQCDKICLMLRRCGVKTTSWASMLHHESPFVAMVKLGSHQ